MSEELPCNLMLVVSEGSCNTPGTTANVRTEVRAALTWPLGRRKEGRVARLESFFVGKSQSAYRLSPELERSLSCSGTSATDDEGKEGRAERFRTTYASKRLKTAPICSAGLRRKPFSCPPKCPPKCPQDRIVAYAF